MLQELMLLFSTVDVFSVCFQWLKTSTNEAGKMANSLVPSKENEESKTTIVHVIVSDEGPAKGQKY